MLVAPAQHGRQTCAPRAGGTFQSRDPSPVEVEEYAAYAAFINQKYIPSYSTPCIRYGDLVEDGELDQKGMVVIAANTRQEFANVVGVRPYMLQLFVGRESNQEGEETFEDLITKSGQPVRPTNAFSLMVRYKLAGEK